MEKEFSLTDTSETDCSGPWWLYIVETRLGHWYTGISTDVARRFAQHESGKGAKNLRGKGPLRLVVALPAGSRAEASRLEYRIKQLSKAQKRGWVDRQISLSGT